jgi:hypothetical protein
MNEFHRSASAMLAHLTRGGRAGHRCQNLV